jgi:type VI secretion system protein ImpK
MPEIRPSPFFLLACFAEFYEEVASIKLAIAEGRLSNYLAVGDETPPTRGADLALRVSSRLAAVLRNQARGIHGCATPAEVKAYTMTQYAMAVLADEIFLLDPELEWSGRKPWLDVLLEEQLFHTRDAGQRFFQHVEQVLHETNRSALHTDLASVFLLALQLGFKGRYRGEHGANVLRDYREQLYRFANQKGHAPDARPAFPQAYQHLVKDKKEQRLAPLSRWYAFGRIALLAYVAVSTLVWVVLMYPFEKAFG